MWNISQLFGGSKPKRDNNPSIYGGDGLTDRSPAIINCASIGVAQLLIDRFISERCGPDYKQGIEFTLAAPENHDKLIKMVCVTDRNGSEHKFYFDLSRPVAVAVKFIGTK